MGWDPIKAFNGGDGLQLRDFVPNSNHSLLHQYQKYQHDQLSAANRKRMSQKRAAELAEQQALANIDSAYGITPGGADLDKQIAELSKRVAAAKTAPSTGPAVTEHLVGGPSAPMPFLPSPLSLPFGDHGGSPGGGPIVPHYEPPGKSPRPDPGEWQFQTPAPREIFGLPMEGSADWLGRLMPPKKNPDETELRSLIKTRNSPEYQKALANKASLDGILGKQKQALLDTGMHSLDAGFGDALRTSRQRLAGQGLSGGSADAGVQSGLITDYLGGRQKLAGAATQAELDARQGLDEQRQELRRDVKLNLSPDLSTLNGMSQQAGAINSAYHNVDANAIGNLFANIGGIAGQANLAAGYGAGGGGVLLNRPPASTTRGRYT